MKLLQNVVHVTRTKLLKIKCCIRFGFGSNIYQANVLTSQGNFFLLHELVVTHHTQTTHYDDVIMTRLASQITSLTVVYSIVYSGVIQRKHQSSASLAFVREIHRGPVNFPHKWPVTRKMFPFDDVIMSYINFTATHSDKSFIKRFLLPPN